MTEDEMKEIFEANKERMKQAALDAVVDKITEDMKYHMPDAIRKAIAEFMEKEVAPSVTKALQSQKGEILKSVQVAAAEIGAALSAQMVSNATKQLTGYRGGEILKKLVDD